MDTSRRTFLTLAGAAPLVLLASGSSRAADNAPAACYDPAALPFSQKSRRRSLAYIEVSADAAKRCGTCTFFTGTQAGCGTCQLLTGGAVNAGAVCGSFAPKAG